MKLFHTFNEVFTDLVQEDQLSDSSKPDKSAAVTKVGQQPAVQHCGSAAEV
jgi:hypothetical protein